MKPNKATVRPLLLDCDNHELDVEFQLWSEICFGEESKVEVSRAEEVEASAVVSAMFPQTTFYTQDFNLTSPPPPPTTTTPSSSSSSYSTFPSFSQEPTQLEVSAPHPGWQLYISYGTLACGGILIAALVVIIIVYCCFYRAASQDFSPNDDPQELITEGGDADCQEKTTDSGSVYQSLNQHRSVYQSLQTKNESVYECIDEMRTHRETQSPDIWTEDN
ncbi:hypothetical protein KOW79_003863 [Hemibagrus wyckioides]|uniref:Uncharacterized protein n=1 Tax=Hemibagrus wyckioides TaxID=337641 RepID=A0A9D3SU57_9TELE|nr:uncharacterized protein LOC131353590 [Hemibagrus wyckioides]KAG7332029.1 hypothetical protein KOW79_003863 [Hemibagrus wyckioides]